MRIRPRYIQRICCLALSKNISSFHSKNSLNTVIISLCKLHLFKESYWTESPLIFGGSSRASRALSTVVPTPLPTRAAVRSGEPLSSPLHSWSANVADDVYLAAKTLRMSFSGGPSLWLDSHRLIRPPICLNRLGQLKSRNRSAIRERCLTPLIVLERTAVCTEKLQTALVSDGCQLPMGIDDVWTHLTNNIPSEH